MKIRAKFKNILNIELDIIISDIFKIIIKYKKIKRN